MDNVQFLFSFCIPQYSNLACLLESLFNHLDWEYPWWINTMCFHFPFHFPKYYYLSGSHFHCLVWFWFVLVFFSIIIYLFDIVVMWSKHGKGSEFFLLSFFQSWFVIGLHSPLLDVSIRLQVVGVGEEWPHSFLNYNLFCDKPPLHKCLQLNSFSIAPIRIIDTRSHNWPYSNKKTNLFF